MHETGAREAGGVIRKGDMRIKGNIKITHR